MIIHVIKYTEKNNNRIAQSLYTNAKQMSNKTRTNSYKCWTEVFETRCMSGAWWAEIVLMSSKLATQLVACQTTFSHGEKRIIANMHRDWMSYVQHSFDICSRLKLVREFKTVLNYRRCLASTGEIMTKQDIYSTSTDLWPSPTQHLESYSEF